MTGRFDLVVRGGVVLLAEGPVHADVAVADGVIAEVAPSVSGDGVEEIDASGLHVFPGLIDSHVHFDEPGRTHWEGFETGSWACAAGGVTTFVDMPLNSRPPTLDGASFDVKLEAARRSAKVDFAFWGGLVPGNLDRLEELARRGVVGVKAFTCHSGIDDFAAADDLTLLEGMARCAELGLLVAVHAENATLVAELAARARVAGHVGVRDVVATRPAIAEFEAIARCILFARETGCALHIVHVSTARGVQMVADAQASGVDVTCETCPHYLLFTEDDVDRLGVLLKCAPPPRTPGDRAVLWELIRDGTLPMVVSDHSPGPPELKVGEDFFALWGGISGCQSTLGVLLAAGHAERDIPLATIADVTSRNIAERFGLGAKGEIAHGKDADLVLVDLAYEGVLQTDELRYRHRTSAFVGSPVKGRVKKTLVRGRAVFVDDDVPPEPVGRHVIAGERPNTMTM